ncbi:MATE family efflux transporter [Mediterraneibacter glycyrrhizinilyticus]|uniref:MATE family efflux transporter n=1 Tax=Mediterraneibacter glycyrrhizinilyticus TaxID=342942 RepID=UPI0019602D0E|nr:MATE family efflux transporter [Mediterraneibacter glycyrrhizinilyticus]MBM6753014.1 MATE family efflux transporter [Mediterraneibacter glycyrrhizinilyticus]
MENELTRGPVMKTMLRFAVPMILGDLLQQCYNIADTLIVGRFLGADALAAVGSAFSLMTFLTSIILGLAMGSGTVFSIRFGQKDDQGLKEGILASFTLLGIVTVVLNILIFAGIDWIIWFLRTPGELVELMKEYLIVIFTGLIGIFLYNFFASLLRSLGNSVVPLIFLAVSAVLNIILDLWFVAGLGRGVAGAAEATVISQYVSGIGITVYARIRFPGLLRKDKDVQLRFSRIKEITSFSGLTCMQQSIMNLGILAVQGLVNSFGTTIMAAFAAAVKIDAFAYLPVQDFGNAFSIFIAQNYGAGKNDRIRKSIRCAVAASVLFSLAVSFLVFVFAGPLMGLFIDSGEASVIAEGTRYLRIEGSFYALIGLLFLLYGLYRAIGNPGMSVILTVVSLGTRVALAYALSAVPAFGVVGIWWSVPIGWFLADALGAGYYFIRYRKRSVCPSGTD